MRREAANTDPCTGAQLARPGASLIEFSERGRTLSLVLAALWTAQALLGLVLSGQYRDVAWIRATWFGNDLVTLVLAVPLLLAGVLRTGVGSRRAQLLWLGMLAYGAYNYAYYMLGAALNGFFPIYVLSLVLSVVTLIRLLTRLDGRLLAGLFRPGTPVRVIGGYLVFVAAGLSIVWLGIWAGYVFAGRPTPVEPEAFRLVAALDLSLMVPALGCGGLLLWRRATSGYLIATIAAVQGAFYLVVLSLNSAIAVVRGAVPPPGEVPIWGTLALCTTAAAALLLASVRRA
ncbi:MAG: hypothetical protein K0R38_4249 [Polyangiaceae bacterium]|jgi:hypothetical protein|nr:hypothetical protein [Polyangiaceae bacterium]